MVAGFGSTGAGAGGPSQEDRDRARSGPCRASVLPYMGEVQKICPRCGASYPADVIFCPKDGAPLGSRRSAEEDPYLGHEIAGQIRLEELIGIGSMGRVYRAHQHGIDRKVAVKIVHRELLTNASLAGRFEREAKVASRLAHPNVVQVLMTGKLDPVGDGGVAPTYLVMEYLDGLSLQSALSAAGGALPMPRALHVMLQLCDAVGEAHAQGIVHRDIKPENVMLVRRGDDPDFVKVLDFGLARLDADESVATRTGAIFGTARYMSPEGAQGHRVEAPGDVYSLTVLLFQLLAGRPPFEGDNPVAILVKHSTEPPPELGSIARAAYVPAAIGRVVRHNLAKDPTNRCADARALGRALIEAIREAGLSVDDLVRRSTLMGGGSALQLSSLEKTRTLGLTPDLQQQMQQGMQSAGGPGGTQLVDGPDEPAASDPAAAFPAPSQPVPPVDPYATRRFQSSPGSRPEASSTQVLDAPRVVTPAPSSTPAPISAPLSQPAASAPPSQTEPAPASFDPGRLSQPTPSERGSAIPSQHDPPAPQSRRWWLFVACFVIGVGLSLVGARQLGVFAEKELTPEVYASRAQEAAASERWSSPKGDNVRDITDSALQRWPGSQAVLEVRRDAARTLTEKARAGNEKGKAIEHLRLALELDPDHRPARELLAQLSAGEDVPPSPEPSAEARAPKPAPLGQPKGPRKSLRPPAPKPTPSAEAPASATPQPAPAPKPGGRWL